MLARIMEAYLPTTFKTLGVLFGCTGLAAGVRAILDPSGQAAAFGIPGATSVTGNASSQANAFIAVCGARTLGSGVTILYLAYTKRWKTIGELLLIGSVCGSFLDSWIVSQYNGIKEKVRSHAIGGLIMIGTAVGLLKYA